MPSTKGGSEWGNMENLDDSHEVELSGESTDLKQQVGVGANCTSIVKVFRERDSLKRGEVALVQKVGCCNSAGWLHAEVEKRGTGSFV